MITTRISGNKLVVFDSVGLPLFSVGTAPKQETQEADWRPTPEQVTAWLARIRRRK